MSFQPIVVGSGLTAWQFLKATQETQRANFDKSPTLARDAEYFASRIGEISSAEEFVSDRRIMRVALSAFGLEDKIDSKFLIQKVLEEGTENDDALANRLSDGRFVALANAFSFEKVLEPKTREPGFADPIADRYRETVLANMEAGLAETGDTDTPYGESVRQQVLLNIETETQFFRDNIGAVTSAEGMIKNPRLFTYALVAFDLGEKAGSPKLMQRVLEQGTDDARDLANVLGDSRYVDLAKAFEFDRDPVSATQREGFADEIVSDFYLHEFEVAVGDVDESLRTALNFERAIPELAGRDSSDNTKWFSVLGTTSLRNVFQAALGLPSGFSQIDVDKQVEVLKDKVSSRYGVKSFSELAEPDVMNRVINTYLLQNQINQTANAGSNQIALTLLSSIPRQSLFG